MVYLSRMSTIISWALQARHLAMPAELPSPGHERWHGHRACSVGMTRAALDTISWGTVVSTAPPMDMTTGTIPSCDFWRELFKVSGGP